MGLKSLDNKSDHFSLLFIPSAFLVAAPLFSWFYYHYDKQLVGSGCSTGDDEGYYEGSR